MTMNPQGSLPGLVSPVHRHGAVESPSVLDGQESQRGTAGRCDAHYSGSGATPCERGGVRGPAAPGPSRPPITPEPGRWSAVGFVPKSQTCRLCFRAIPRSAPPGPKPEPPRAFYNATLNDWECVGCRREADRVAAAIAGPSWPALTGTGDLGAPSLTTPGFEATLDLRNTKTTSTA